MATTCPVCKENSLSAYDLETNLHASKCGRCGGVFVSAAQYEQWLRLHGDNLPEKAAEQGVTLASAEVPGIKFCPECKYMLLKYKVGHSLSFSLNRCGHCGGMWFDKNEWEILKSRNLHDDAHLVFSQEWQSAVRAEEHQTALDDIVRTQVGDADFKEAQRIKTWLQKHPKSAELYAYLMSGKDDAKRSASVPAR